MFYILGRKKLSSYFILELKEILGNSGIIGILSSIL